MYFFFNDTATTEIYTLSLHDALPICGTVRSLSVAGVSERLVWLRVRIEPRPQQHRLRPAQRELAMDLIHVIQRVQDRKSTRLNSSHANISYAVFCLKKKTYTFVHDR